MAKDLILDGEVKALSKRKLSEETCRKFGYTVGTSSKGNTVQLAPYFDGQQMVAQKMRDADKNFVTLGDFKNAGLFGQQLWRDGGKKVVVTEGEIDCMTVSQLQGNKWPVVSVPNGAQGAKKSLQKHLEWLEQFEEVVLMFDMDDPGKEAMAECAALFTPGKCKLASLPLKDANEMLVAGRGAEVIDAIWGAKSYKPDGIVSIGDLRPKLSKPIERGLSWPWDALTEATYGIREDEMYALGAGTGMGKSEIWKEVMVHLVEKHGQKVGGIFLEETPEHTVRCLAGKAKSKRFHVPDAGWTEEEFEKAVDDLDGSQSVFLYDHFGHTDYDTVKARIRFMVVSLGCKHIFLDHVTALASGAREMDERKELEYIMTDLASMLRELHFTLYFISHLNTPEGKPHEEGGRVMIRHFKGSRAIGQWSSFMFGLERNQQEENEKLRHVSLLRILKDRYTGQGTGTVIPLGYDTETGRLKQLDSNPFDDETTGGSTPQWDEDAPF
jgi:twinkle protein